MRKARQSIPEQEGLIFGVYADMIEHGHIDDMFDLMRHARIKLDTDPVANILRHYWLGADRGYDIDRAFEDFASWPPIANRVGELRCEHRRQKHQTNGT